MVGGRCFYLLAFWLDLEGIETEKKNSPLSTQLFFSTENLRRRRGALGARGRRHHAPGGRRRGRRGIGRHRGELGAPQGRARGKIVFFFFYLLSGVEVGYCFRSGVFPLLTLAHIENATITSTNRRSPGPSTSSRPWSRSGKRSFSSAAGSGRRTRKGGG